MLETIAFKKMKEHIEKDCFNKHITEQVIYNCERCGVYVVNWCILTDTFIVVYNDYSVSAYDLY